MELTVEKLKKILTEVATDNEYIADVVYVNDPMYPLDGETKAEAMADRKPLVVIDGKFDLVKAVKYINLLENDEIKKLRAAFMEADKWIAQWCIIRDMQFPNSVSVAWLKTKSSKPKDWPDDQSDDRPRPDQPRPPEEDKSNE